MRVFPTGNKFLVVSVFVVLGNDGGDDRNGQAVLQHLRAPATDDQAATELRKTPSCGPAYARRGPGDQDD